MPLKASANEFKKLVNTSYLFDFEFGVLPVRNEYALVEHIEEIIKKCKYVEDCTVVAVPHKIKSQTPKAVIVLKKDVEDTLAVRSEIRKYCMDNIARYAIPTEFEYRKDIPKTAIGKVAYRDLQK